ncbi:MAG: TonB-dependent receptor [Bacteroidales bacterium]|nr:TonB-dependent receptor [Bacteroidales bacterium]
MKYISLVCLFITVVPSIIMAQQNSDTIISISEITVSAKRIFRKEDAGMRVDEVDTLVLMKKINMSLSDLLSENTSLFIKNNGRGALATASFRGTASSHTQVRWNGMNINSPMTGMVDFSLIPVYVIDDINIKHGGASISDQSGGLGGAININNKVDWDNRFSGRFLQGVGSYTTFDEFAQINVGNEKLQSKTRLYYNYSKNDYTYVNRSIANNIDPATGEFKNREDKNRNADYTKYGAMQEFFYRPNKRNILSVKWWGQWADRTIPRATSYEGPDNSNLNNQDDKDNKVVADWKHFMRNGTLIVRTGYTNKRLVYSVKNNVPGQGLIFSVNSDSEINSSLSDISYIHNINSTMSAKFSADFNYHDVVSNESVKKTGYNKDRKEISLFGSLSKEFFERVNLNAMLRYTYIDGEDTPLIPFFGFDYKLLENHNLLVKGSISRNYHHPSLNDLYWQPGGNPDLKPERGFSFEAGTEYSGKIYGCDVSAEVTAYRSDIDNWIIWIPSFKGFWEPRNIKRVLSYGIEANASVAGNIDAFSYKLFGTYAYTKSVNYGDPLVWGDNSYGKQLVYIPVHSGNVLVNVGYRGYTLMYQYNFYSERFTTSSNDVTRRDWLYPYYMSHMSLKKEKDFNNYILSAELKVFNLFNETYHSVLYRPMPKMNFMLLLTLRI